MHGWTWLLVVLGLAVGVSAGEPEPGRTDGPEGSEYGKGGYRYFRTDGRLFVEGFFGAARVAWEAKGASDSNSTTDLIAGINAGYQVEDWLSFQLGYGHISDQKINLFAGGMRSAYNLEPFSYFFSLDAELFSPDKGEEQFALVPGVGAEMVLNDHLRVGLGYQHDFIFADDNMGIDRVTARVQFRF